MSSSVFSLGLSKESLWLIVITMADLLSTIWLIETGRCIEVNPLMNYVLGFGWLAFIVVKASTVVLAVSVAEWYRKTDDVFARRWLRIGCIAYVAVWCSWFSLANFR